jgi:hypothetical protein
VCACLCACLCVCVCPIPRWKERLLVAGGGPRGTRVRQLLVLHEQRAGVHFLLRLGGRRRHQQVRLHIPGGAPALKLQSSWRSLFQRFTIFTSLFIFPPSWVEAEQSSLLDLLPCFQIGMLLVLYEQNWNHMVLARLWTRPRLFHKISKTTIVFESSAPALSCLLPLNKVGKIGVVMVKPKLDKHHTFLRDYLCQSLRSLRSKTLLHCLANWSFSDLAWIHFHICVQAESSYKMALEHNPWPDFFAPMYHGWRINRLLLQQNIIIIPIVEGLGLLALTCTFFPIYHLEEAFIQSELQWIQIHTVKEKIRGVSLQVLCGQGDPTGYLFGWQ